MKNITVPEHDDQTLLIPGRNPAESPVVEVSDLMRPNVLGSSSPDSAPRKHKTKVSSPRSLRRTQLLSTSANVSVVIPPSPTETVSTSRASSPTQKRVSEISFGGSSFRHSSSSYASSDAGTSANGWPSPGPSRDSFPVQYHAISSMKVSSLPRTPEVCEIGQRVDDRHLSLLPPPAMGLTTQHELDEIHSHASQTRLSPYPSTQPNIMKLHRSSTTASQKVAFEKEAFRNSAVLCDV